MDPDGAAEAEAEELEAWRRTFVALAVANAEARRGARMYMKLYEI